MRYIIQWGREADREKPARLTTFTAELAETPEAACTQFLARHPDYYIEDVKPAGPNSFEAYGLGAWTEEEREQHREKLGRMYAEQRTERATPMPTARPSFITSISASITFFSSL